MQQIATPVWQMRALLNWERQVMIKELIDDNNTAIVAQLYSSHGLDFGKWCVKATADMCFITQVSHH